MANPKGIPWKFGPKNILVPVKSAEPNPEEPKDVKINVNLSDASKTDLSTPKHGEISTRGDPLMKTGISIRRDSWKQDEIPDPKRRGDSSTRDGRVMKVKVKSKNLKSELKMESDTKSEVKMDESKDMKSEGSSVGEWTKSSTGVQESPAPLKSTYQIRMERIQTTVLTKLKRWEKWIWYAVYGILILAYHAYFMAAIVLSGHEKALALIIMTSIAWFLVLYYYVYIPYVSAKLEAAVCPRIKRMWKFINKIPHGKCAMYVAIVVSILVFLIVDARDDWKRLVSLAGLITFLLLGFLGSYDMAGIKWQPIIVGLGLQFCLCLTMFRQPWAQAAIEFIAEQTTYFLANTKKGTDFVYGFISNPPNICGLSLVLMFTVFQTMVFFGSVVSVLYYYGVVQFVVKRVGWLVQITLGTTAAESLCAVASVILGQSETPLIIRPYLRKLTDSEFHQILTSGYASIAGSLFAAYISFGACVAHLLIASVMAAPMSIVASKLMYPETERSRTRKMEHLRLEEAEEKSVIEAISNGATSVVSIVLIVGANLVVFIAGVAFLNTVIAWLGSMVGLPTLSLELIFAYLFFPMAFLMGVSDCTEETMLVAELIGTKTVLNEFIAYRKMEVFLNQGKLGPRAQMIATFALCGFSNIGSIGVQVGALTGMCPEKKHVIPRLAVRSLFAGCLSTFMSACLAGLLNDKLGRCFPAASGDGQCVNLDAISKCCNGTSANSSIY